MPTRARRSKLPVIPHREGITLPPGRSAGGGLDQRGGYRLPPFRSPTARSGCPATPATAFRKSPPIRWRGKSPSPHAAWCRRRSAGTPQALSTRQSRFSARAAPERGAAIRLRVPGKASRPGAAGTSHGNAVKLAEIRLLHIRAGYRGQSGLGQRNGSRQRQRSRRERGGAQELLHACYNRRADEAVHKAPVRHRPANGLLPTAPDGLARPVRSSAEGSCTSQPTMHVPHRSPGSALIKVAQSYASPAFQFRP